MLITVELVAYKLIELPQVIAALEQVAYEQELVLQERKNRYKEMEAGLLVQENGPINGKNEAIRTAQLYDRLAPERILIEIAEKEVAQTRLQLGMERNRYKSWLAISALMAALAIVTIDGEVS